MASIIKWGKKIGGHLFNSDSEGVSKTKRYDSAEVGTYVFGAGGERKLEDPLSLAEAAESKLLQTSWYLFRGSVGFSVHEMGTYPGSEAKEGWTERHFNHKFWTTT